MKKREHPHFVLIAAAILTQVYCAGFVLAQSRMVSTITRESGNKTTGIGRDYWLTIPQNYTAQGGQYFALYVTSSKNTIAYIQVTGGSTSKWPISAGQILTFYVPLSWGVTTSGIVEQKGIHVWSDNADLIVHFLSRNPATSDGMLIIPTTGWGKEYVVGAYTSLFQGYGTFADFPSEFSIIADQDSTICAITPNCNIRTTGLALHSAHITFTDTLNRGQCVQYQAVQAQNCGDYDVTGTIVTGSKPFGLVGASQCPNIPCENLYCNHICDMIPPVRIWGKTYHTIPFNQRIAGDTYLVIGSKDNQNIYRNDDDTKTRLYCTLANKYNYYFRPDVADPSVWTSDAPFLLVQYINSSTYEGSNGGSSSALGDPAMVVINSVEQYTPHVIFQTPNIQANGFSNYVNVMVNNNAIINTTFDGIPINKSKGATRLLIPNTHYTAFRIAQVAPGKHEVMSDSGIGIYVYGYGSYDSYAWSGNLGIATTNSPDTIPPAARMTGQCFSLHVSLSDSGMGDSKINSIVTDSLFNMSFNPDPNFLAGAWISNSFYDLSIVDSTKEAYAKIFVYDVAGNRTTVTSLYKPQLAKIIPSVGNYGIAHVGTVLCNYFSIVNTGNIPYSYKSLHLLFANKGFTIDSMRADSTIPVGDSLVIKICFAAPSPNAASDTLELSDGCTKLRALLFANGGTPDFTLSDNDFKCVNIGSLKTDTLTVVTNQSPATITIDSIWVDDPVHFAYKGIPILPLIISAGTNAGFIFSFTPDKAGNFATKVHFRSKEAGIRTATINGCGQIPASVIADGYASSLSKNSTEFASLSSRLDRGEKLVILPPMPNPVSRESNNSIRFVYGVSESEPLKLSLYDELGKEVAVIFDDNYPAGIYETRFALPANLQDGSYIYRLTSSWKVLSGKLVILH